MIALKITLDVQMVCLLMVLLLLILGNEPNQLNLAVTKGYI